jgi:serine/threonine protein kinase
MSKVAISFMKDLLKINPKERLTAIQALRHDYFRGMNSLFLLRGPQSNRESLRGSSKNENELKTNYIKR